MTGEGMWQRANGDTVAFCEYGDANGEPVFFFHGWPSSRTMAELTNDAARELQLRVIAIDRPGVGDSSFRAERTLLDWPALVAEVADYLNVERFRVLGISGGAPYAYATGFALPQRVAAIAVVSGAPPIAELNDHGGLLRLYRWGIALDRRVPRLLRTLFRVAQPIAARRIPVRVRPLFLKTFQRCDADVLQQQHAFDACFESSRRAWQASASGVLAEAEIYIRPWGFRLEDVRVPVRLWHGTSDRAFHFSLAQQVAERLPNCELRLIENAGHYSTPIRHMREILADLESCSTTAPI